MAGTPSHEPTRNKLYFPNPDCPLTPALYPGGGEGGEVRVSTFRGSTYASQSKDEFVAAMDQKMKEMDAKIKSLADKSVDYKDDAKIQRDKALAELRDDREKLGKKYDELKQSSQDAWEKTKEGFVSAWDGLTNAFESAKAKF